jgi:hypothetical protein
VATLKTNFLVSVHLSHGKNRVKRGGQSFLHFSSFHFFASKIYFNFFPFEKSPKAIACLPFIFFHDFLKIVIPRRTPPRNHHHY